MPVELRERDMTEAEYGFVKAGFQQHGVAFGNPAESSGRFGFVAVQGETFVGCSSGLAYRKDVGYADWFYLTDLFVAKPFRGQGIGGDLLDRLEQRVASLGVGHIWTWTAEYEAPHFYRRRGYEVFLKKTHFYASGHARIGLYKRLAPASEAPPGPTGRR